MGMWLKTTRSLLRNKEGPTVVECALFLAFVVLFYVAVTTLIGH